MRGENMTDSDYFFLEVDFDFENNELLICDLLVNDKGEHADWDTLLVRAVCDFGKQAGMYILWDNTTSDKIKFWRENGFVSLDDTSSKYILEKQLESYQKEQRQSYPEDHPITLFHSDTAWST
jgi:hypothetical protein